MVSPHKDRQKNRMEVCLNKGGTLYSVKTRQLESSCLGDSVLFV